MLQFAHFFESKNSQSTRTQNAKNPDFFLLRTKIRKKTQKKKPSKTRRHWKRQSLQESDRNKELISSGFWVVPENLKS
jgi:hypothetical protein